MILLLSSAICACAPAGQTTPASAGSAASLSSETTGGADPSALTDPKEPSAPTAPLSGSPTVANSTSPVESAADGSKTTDSSPTAGSNTTDESASPTTKSPDSSSESPDPSSEPPDPSSESPTDPPDLPEVFVYLGVRDYGAAETVKARSASFLYRFFSAGAERSFAIVPSPDASGEETYALQNRLIEGKLYYLTLKNEKISDLRRVPFTDGTSGTLERSPDGALTLNGEPFSPDPLRRYWRVSPAAGGARIERSSANEGDFLFLPCGASDGYILPPPAVCEPAIHAEAGKRTLLNFLRTALMPVGNALYVYGGGWDWQDVASSSSARSIGLSPDWAEFFDQHDASYHYKNDDETSSYYPFGGFNEYWYAGLDCSGFVGWTLYNLMNTESGEEGFVGSSTVFAKRLADEGYGSFTRGLSFSEAREKLRPGDIISIKRHIYICLSVCGDGSVLIVHSTPGQSRTGARGGGVQLSAVGYNRSCDAYLLADRLMKRYAPDWYARYEVQLCSPSLYFDFSTDQTGFFRFYPDDRGVTDPDGAASMTAGQLTAALFGE